jgi:hypothetical protein
MVWFGNSFAKLEPNVLLECRSVRGIQLFFPAAALPWTAILNFISFARRLIRQRDLG